MKKLFSHLEILESHFVYQEAPSGADRYPPGYEQMVCASMEMSGLMDEVLSQMAADSGFAYENKTFIYKLNLVDKIELPADLGWLSLANEAAGCDTIPSVDKLKAIGGLLQDAEGYIEDIGVPDVASVAALNVNDFTEEDLKAIPDVSWRAIDSAIDFFNVDFIPALTDMGAEWSGEGAFGVYFKAHAQLERLQLRRPQD